MYGKPMSTNRINRIIKRFCRWTEAVLSVLITIVIIISIFVMVVSLIKNPEAVESARGFGLFLEEVLYFIVGIEMVKMLMTHRMEDVMDVLILAMARHMLVTHTSVEGTLLQIIGICLLFLVRCVIRKFSNTEKKDEWDEDCDDCR